MRDGVKVAASKRDKHAQQAAYLRARHNLSQEEIGRLLGGMSQSHVSRLLSRAAELGWLVTELRFDERNVSPEAMQEVEYLLQPRWLASYFERIRAETRRVTPAIRVFDSGGESSTASAFDIRVRRFGRSASGRLEELLRRSRIIGVTWGRTISSLIDGLVASNRSFRTDQPFLFVPVSAELVTFAASEYSSSLLAARLEDAVNHGVGERFRLVGVPAYIPRRYESAKAQAIREYILDTASYRQIFGPERPLINLVDTIVTSVGSAQRPLGGALEEVLSAGDISAEELKQLIIGDVGGVLIPKSTLSLEGRQLVDCLNGMWTGVTKDHISRLALRSLHGGGGAGVVVVAIGKERAEIVAEMIRLEMINELIADWSLANALEECLR